MPRGAAAADGDFAKLRPLPCLGRGRTIESILPATWTVLDTKPFLAAIKHYTADIKTRGAELRQELLAEEVGVDHDEKTRLWLLDDRDFQTLQVQILAFEARCCDPRFDKRLRCARERLKRIPNVYYMRVGHYYAYFERQATTRTVTALMLTRKADRAWWMLEILMS